MKVSEAALSLLVLILIITSASCSQPKVPEWVNTPSTCCLKYYEKVLPRRLVVGYRKALNCHLPAIIFVTKRNREVCTNPNDDWVQEYIKDPNLPLLPTRNLATVKIITAKNGQPQLLNSQ
ncbi:C-C motif chemokine 16 [Nomascus leucogenys]|uniref:C-C motif chemokine 16 n=1 Tax=Nomascus leucogenys TaxID=61853 RepID=UPI00122D7DDB|nr:C-C motif chemokine 16 [Nomascus leucogenys]XP_032018924.1 C-C motif chemokine 16 [Hylobates moloch]